MRITLRQVVPDAGKKRECGTCSLCCKLLAIKDEWLTKAQGEWCSHVVKGGGCGCYETRPSVCRGFECLWLSSTVSPIEMRPDKIKGVLTVTTDGHHIVLHEDPAYPNKARLALKPMLDKWIEDGAHYYVVVREKRRWFYGNPRLLPAASEMMNQAIGQALADAKETR